MDARPCVTTKDILISVAFLVGGNPVILPAQIGVIDHRSGQAQALLAEDPNSALYTTALAVNTGGMAADHGLRALERPRAAFVGSLIGLTVTVTAAALLAMQWGIAGAAIGYLIGNAAGTLARGGAFLWLSAARAEDRQGDA